MADVQEEVSIEQLQSLIRDEAEFTKFFKKHAFDAELCSGEWKQDGKRGWRLNLLDGSYVRIKFFDTVKRIRNAYGIEIPGKESFLSYLDVAVMPVGIKGYTFTMDVSQHPVAYAKGRPPAKESHAKSIEKIVAKADKLGIDLSAEDAWETYFAGLK